MPNHQQYYTIRVRGILHSHWSERFMPLSIRYEQDDTLLSGVLPDQAAVYGILAKLQALGLELVGLYRHAPENLAANSSNTTSGEESRG